MNMYKEIIIHGRVQGVNFRRATVEQALQLGIVGAVRNLPDGTVYIEAEGDSEAMHAFLDWCHQGPASAEVTLVDTKDAAPKGFKDFRME